MLKSWSLNAVSNPSKLSTSIDKLGTGVPERPSVKKLIRNCSNKN
ncbi:hypothetical protein [Staphylococcus durrellii]|nr:hypothetical protein [Staphylococcus durrellii]